MGVEAAEVRAELERILAHESFAPSARLSRLLRYVVERTLAGEGDQLKEYVLGVEVFDRDDKYDPRVDSIVRVEARRLRTRLDEYYAGPGAANPVVIRLQRGGYAPTFERRRPVEAPASSAPLAAPDVSPATSAATIGAQRSRRTIAAALIGAAAVAIVALAAWQSTPQSRRSDPARPAITVAVLPIAYFGSDAGGTLLAARLTDGITAELARHRELGVVSRTSASEFASRGRPLREIARDLGADAILEASLHAEGDALRVEARLVDGASDRKFWVEEFRAETRDVRALQQQIAAGMAKALAARVTALDKP